MLNYSDAILIALDAAGGKIIGRTAIQKLLYLASQRRIIEETYFPHYYGPYSVQASNSLLELCSLGFVEEELEHSSTIKREWRRFSYRLTESGRAYLDFTRDERDEQEELSTKNMSELVQKAMKLTSLDVQSLSCAAKVKYFVKRESPITKAKMRRLAGQFGWNLSHEQINQATNLLIGLQLVKVV